MKKLSILFAMFIGLQAADNSGPENADQAIEIALIANDQLATAGATTSETGSQSIQPVQPMQPAQIQVIQVVQPTQSACQSVCTDILRLCSTFYRFLKANLWCPCRFHIQ